MAEGGAYLNNARVADEDAVVGPEDLLGGGVAGAPSRQAHTGRGPGERRVLRPGPVGRRRADLRICVSGRGLSNVLHVARQGETDTGSVAVPGVAPSVTNRAALGRGGEARAGQEGRGSRFDSRVPPE